MSLSYNLRQRCHPNYNSLARTLSGPQPIQWIATPSICIQLPRYPTSTISRLSPLVGADSRQLFSTASHTCSRHRPFDSPVVPQGTENEVYRAQKSFQALRARNRQATSPGKLLLDYRVSGHPIPPVEGPIVAQDDNAVQRKDEDYLPDVQEIRDTVTQSLESDEIESLSQGSEGSEATDGPTLISGASGLSPEVCYTPSEALLYSLGSLSRLYATHRDFSNKIDLSHANPLVIARNGRSDLQPRPGAQPKTVDLGPFFPTVRLSLQRLLAEYLRSCWPQGSDVGSPDVEPTMNVSSEQTLQNVFSEANVTFIRDQGYEPEDLASWAWVVTARSTDRAVARLMALTAGLKGDLSERRMVPPFLSLFILRRKEWSALAVRMMITYGWDRLEGRVITRASQQVAFQDLPGVEAHLSQSEVIPDSGMSKQMLVIMVIRLLRHARKAWPEACVSISTMLTKHERAFSPALHKRLALAELTFLYNTILSLLALPASMYPFLSISAQQQAQFIVLRRMNEFEPALAIDREGYRAVIRVQLAHKKTIQERDWASLKAKSWPPWKEDKSGLDATKDAKYGTSRASQVIKQMQEAGYAVQEWEASAEILAGWDTDQTPTIQKRTLLPRPVMARRKRAENNTSEQARKTDIWVARIQATRTADEAWACFLAFKDSRNQSNNFASSAELYYALAEKLIFDHKRTKARKQDNIQEDTSLAESDTPLPGDGKEVYERPGPREAIYVRSSPPDIDKFYDLMLQDQIPSSPRFLALVLSNASSFRSGLHYLNSSHLPTALVVYLLTGNPAPKDYPLGHELMPPYLFAALIHFLSKFAQQVSHTDLAVIHLPGARFFGTGRPRINSLAQACKLMGAYKPYYRPPWNSLLLVLARKGVSLKLSAENVDERIQGVAAWKAIQDVIGQMQSIGLGLDFSDFRHVCVGYEKAITASAELADIPDISYVKRHLGGNAGNAIDGGLPYIKHLFNNIVYGGPGGKAFAMSDSGTQVEEYLLPRLLETPSPAQIHPYIRVLGLREDHEGLVEMVEWIARFAPELQARAEEVMNGKRMLRRCLTAAVVFLEQSWLPRDQRITYDKKDPDSSLVKDGESTSKTVEDGPAEEIQSDSTKTLEQRFRQAVEENPGWGGWPTDDETDVYMGKYRAGQ